MPSRASSRTQTRSASWAPLQAVLTMARSSRRFGRKMPGVSTRMIWAWFSITMPRISARVVCTLRDTIVTLEPSSALTSVDLPTLGAPISATKPQRVSADSALVVTSSVIAATANPFAREHHRGCDLLGSALAAANAFGRRQAGQIDGDAELWIVVRTGALDLAVDRRRQSLALRPFLQHGLGVAQRAHRLAHPLGPVALDEFGRGGIATVEIDRADHRFADVAEHGFAQARAGAGPDGAELDALEQSQRLGDVDAALAAHQVGQPLRQLAFVGLGKGAIEHVGNHQAEHVIAEKFEALVAIAAAARRFQRRDMGEGGGEQRRIGELMTDARLDLGRRGLGAGPGALLLGRRSFPTGVGLRARIVGFCRFLYVR